MRRNIILRTLASIAAAVLFLLALVGPARAATTPLYNDGGIRAPSWWNGDTCDSTHFNAGAVAQSSADRATLLTTWEGLQVCGYGPDQVVPGTSPTQHGVDVSENMGAGSAENEFECTELVKRYLYLKYGVPPLGADSGHPLGVDGANVVDAYTNNNGWTHGYPNLFSEVANNGTNQVQVGDVLSYSSPDDHTAIVSDTSHLHDATNPHITVIEQNADSSGEHDQSVDSSGKILNGVDNGSANGNTVLAWLHPNTEIPSANPTSQSVLRAVSTDSNDTATYTASVPNDAWAVGQYYVSGTGYEPLVEEWDGKQWNQKTVSSDTYSGDHNLYGVKAFSPSDVWAVGYYMDNTNTPQTIIEHWDGSNWSTDALGSGYLFAIDGTSDNDLWAVGQDYSSGYPITLYRTSGSWSTFSNGLTTRGGFTSISAFSSSNIWMAGSDYAGNSYTAHYNGTSWSSPTTTNVGYLYGIVDLGSSNAFAVGGDSVLQWNGSSWSTNATLNSLWSTHLDSISAYSSSNLWISGTYSSYGTKGLIYHSDDGGSTWTQITSVDTGGSDDELVGISVYQPTGLVWAVGRGYSYGYSTLTELFA